MDSFDIVIIFIVLQLVVIEIVIDGLRVKFWEEVDLRNIITVLIYLYLLV